VQRGKKNEGRVLSSLSRALSTTRRRNEGWCEAMMIGAQAGAGVAVATVATEMVLGSD